MGLNSDVKILLADNTHHVLFHFIN